MRKYSKRNSYTDEEFILAIKDSLSIAQVLRKLGLVVAGGNYATVNTKIKNLELDTSHFTGKGWNKGGKSWRPIRALKDILVVNSTYKSSWNLKKRLIKEGLLEEKCHNCMLTEWMGVPIPLELEHINGIHSDNRLENLTLLCPNCHALTPTYRGKNIGKSKN